MEQPPRLVTALSRKPLLHVRAVCPPLLQLLIEGNNLLRVMGIEGVNASRTTSNDVIEVEATLGIEAARSVVCELVV